jgi:hypothetical protein
MGEDGQKITIVHRIDRSDNGTSTAPEVQDPDVPQNDEVSKYTYEPSVIETDIAEKGLTQALADGNDETSTHRWRWVKTLHLQGKVTSFKKKALDALSTIVYLYILCDDTENIIQVNSIYQVISGFLC